MFLTRVSRIARIHCLRLCSVFLFLLGCQTLTGTGCLLWLGLPVTSHITLNINIRFRLLLGIVKRNK